MSPPDAEQGFAPSRPALEPYERDAGDKPPFVLSLAEIKLLGITGVSPRIRIFLSSLLIVVQVGFFLDGIVKLHSLTSPR